MSPQPTAVLLAHDFYPSEGGIQTLMRSLVSADAGVSWTVVTRETAQDAPDDHALRVHRTPMRPRMRLRDQAWIRVRSSFTVADLIAFQAEKTLLAVARHVKPRFLFADQYWTAVAVRNVARQLGCRWGFGVYGKELLGAVPQREETLRQADLVIAPSSFSRRLAIECGARDEKTRVVHPAVDTHAFTPGDRDDARASVGLTGSRVLLTVAHLVPRKGHSTVIRALPALLKRHPDVVYAIVGRGGHEAALRRLAGELGVSQAVHFAGYVGREELLAFYRAADVHVMPSVGSNDDVEGFGISLIEAAACGTPSIGSRSGGMPDAIEDGVTGYLVDADDPGALSERLHCLLQDENRRHAMGQAARERAESRFDDRAFRRSLMDAFELL